MLRRLLLRMRVALQQVLLQRMQRLWRAHWMLPLRLLCVCARTSGLWKARVCPRTSVVCASQGRVSRVVSCVRCAAVCGCLLLPLSSPLPLQRPLLLLSVLLCPLPSAAPERPIRVSLRVRCTAGGDERDRGTDGGKRQQTGHTRSKQHTQSSTARRLTLHVQARSCPSRCLQRTALAALYALRVIMHRASFVCVSVRWFACWPCALVCLLARCVLCACRCAVAPRSFAVSPRFAVFPLRRVLLRTTHGHEARSSEGAAAKQASGAHQARWVGGWKQNTRTTDTLTPCSHAPFDN